MLHTRHILKLLVLISLCFFNKTEAQNLVPNGNFEEFKDCPEHGEFNACANWLDYNNFGSCDFFHTCSQSSGGVPSNWQGYQYAANGKGYGGLYTIVRKTGTKEYMRAVIPPLIVGATYELSMSLSLSNTSQYATNDIGAFFYLKGPNFVSIITPLTLKPHISYEKYGVLADTANWTRVTGLLVADSAYTSMVIGGFKDSASMIRKTVGTIGEQSYYYVDSIVLRLVRIKLAFADSAICHGDTMIIVPYNVMPGATFDPGNVFTLQLSDAYGSFNNPLDIGSVSSTFSGSIQGIIPRNIPFGIGYRLRIVSSNPPDYSPDNGFNIVLNFDVTAGSNSPVCEKDTLKLTATELVAGIQYKWTGPSFSSIQKNPTINDISSGGDYIVAATYLDCTANDTAHVTVKLLPAIIAFGNSPVCIGDTLELHIETSSLNPIFNWSGPDFHSTEQNPFITDVKRIHGGIYIAKASVDGCSSQPSNVSVEVTSLPAFDLGEDRFICNGEEVILGKDYKDAIFSWNNGATEPYISKSTGGIYIESITNSCGTATDEIKVSEIPCDNCLFIPTAFTPNEDGKNDKFGAISRCELNNYSLKVFNRWGQIVFQTNNISEKWNGLFNGTPAEVGRYFYLAQYKPGTENLILKGTVVLIR
jgi:gliding motility-associated-like protein